MSKKVIIVPFTTRPYYYSECGCAIVLERIIDDSEYYAKGECEHYTVIVEADETSTEGVDGARILR